MALRDIQSNIQKAKAARDKQLAASTAATQSGSTSTPTTTETPKVISTPKPQPSTQPVVTPQTVSTPTQPVDLTKINLFKPQEQIQTAQQIQQQYGDVLSQKQEEQKTPNLFKRTSEASKQAKERISNWINEKTGLFDITDLTVESVKNKDVTGGELAKLFGKSAWYGIANWSADTQRTLLNWGTEFAQNKLEKLSKVMDYMGLDSSKLQQGSVSLDEFRNNMLDKFDKTLEYLDENSYVSQYTNNGISLQSALKHGDIRGVISLLGSQFGSMSPMIAAGIASGGSSKGGQLLSMFAANLPSMANETMEMLLADDTIDASYETKLKYATAAGALKSIIESLDTMFEFFSGGKVVPVKKKVINTLIKKKIASIASEMGEEMAQWEVDEIVAKMLGSERDRTSFADLVQNVGFEAAIYAIFFPTGTIEGINQKKINAMYEDIEKEVKEDIPDATPEQIEQIAKEIVKNAYNGGTEIGQEDINTQLQEAFNLSQEATNIDTELKELRQYPVENEPQIKELETRLDSINTQLDSIDEQLNKYIDVQEKLPAQQQTQQYIPQQQGGENLSKQTMVEPDRASVLVSQKVGTRDKGLMRTDFKRSVQQIQSGKAYTNTPFAKYAYSSSGQTMRGDQKQRDQMIKKVESLLDSIGIDLAFTSRGREVLGNGVVGQYRPNDNAIIYRRGLNEMTVYGHEVFHAMMDVIMNGKLTDKSLQSQLQSELKNALADVKKQFGLDGLTSKTEIKYANVFAEEWLANAFGEYLAKRELTGPKTFRQRISKFFDRVINAFSLIFKKDKALKPELERAFESIARGDVKGRKSVDGFIYDYGQQGGENLSKQTMGVSEDRISLTDKQTKNFQSKYWSWQKQTPETVSKFINKISKLEKNKAIVELSQYKNISSIGATIDALLSNNSSIAPKNVLENVRDKISETEKYIESEQDNIKKEKQKTFEGYKTEGVGDIDTYALIKLETADHLVGLKDSQLKGIKDNLTEQQKKDVAKAFAIVSTILGIDFNIVTDGKYFGLTIGEKIPRKSTLGKALYANDMLNLGIILTLQHGPTQAASTLAHEMGHILDYAWSKDNGNTGFSSVMNKYYDLFNSYILKEKGGHDSYLSKPTEIFARFTQQYVAYMTDKEVFDAMAEDKYMSKYTNSIDDGRFWSEEKFNELLPTYLSILDNDMLKYTMSPNNMQYAELMEKLDDYVAKKQFISDEKWLSDIEKRNPGTLEDDVKNAMLDMEKEYVRLSAIAEGLEGDIRTEIWNEYQVALSMLNSNLDMLNRLKDKYINMVQNTKEQQTQIDEGVNNVSDNGPELISEVQDNQQEGDVIDDAMKQDIEEDKEPDTTEPLDVAVNKTVNKVERSVDKMIKDKNKKNAIREVGQGIKDVFTPALSRLYSISPRLAGAVHVYQASVGLKTLGYKRLSENFVKELDNLKKKNPEAYKKLSLALFDWGMDESIDIKQSLKDAGLDEKLFEPVVSILNQIATEYQSAGLDITINDKYFPRKVKDYGLLLDYLSRKSGKTIEGTKEDLLNRIKNINEDPSLSDGEKEARIHNILINEFTKPSERSNNAKERKLVLSEWLLTDEERKQGYKNDITDFYEDPIVSLSNYIDDMVKKTELKKMLGGLTNEKTAISEEFDDSIAKILLDMEARGELTPEKAEEAKKVIKSIVNARATGKGAQGIKNAVYSMTIANRLSAAQQLEDLSKALLRGPTGFKNIVKSIIGKANIKMDDTGLENAFAQFEGGNITDTLFKLSGFDAVDSLGKNSFLNTAYDSCVRQANSEKRNIILKTRLTQMYGEEMGNSIFESYKNNELRDKDGHLKLDVMVDLMYQLGNTQPIYKSAMPTAYLNNPKIRVVYCLWSFTVKQVDWFIQGTKEVYNNQRLLGRSKEIASMAATGRCIGALSVVSIISAMVTDLINWAKGDDDELMLKKWEEEGFGAFLKQFGINSLSGLLKIFNISKYDQYIFKREGIGGVLMSKITPAPLSIFSDIGQVLLGKEELASMGKYMPLFLKPLYYQFKNRDMLPDYKLWGGIQKGKGGIDFGGGSRKIDFGGGSKKIDFGGSSKKIDFGGK